MISFRNMIIVLLCGMTAFLAWRVRQLGELAAGTPPVAVMDWGGITNPLNYANGGADPAAMTAAAAGIARDLASEGWLVLDKGAVVYPGSAQVVSFREVRQYLQSHPELAAQAAAGGGAGRSGSASEKQMGGTHVQNQ